MEQVNNKRIIQFDVLRILAAFTVVLLHVNDSNFACSFPSQEWEYRNIYGALVRWCVPVFVMISGALFLNLSKEISIKTLFTKNIFRIIYVFFFWAIPYAIYDGFANHNTNIFFIIGLAIDGEFHLWFLKMLVGLYLAVPILRVIVQKKRIEEYFIALAILTAFFIPMLNTVIGMFSETAKGYAVRYFEVFSLKIATGYVGYFVLGHYLNTYRLSAGVKRIIYVMGCLSVLLAAGITHWYSHSTGAVLRGFYNYLNLFTLMETLAVFLFVRDLNVSPKFHPIIMKLSSLSFGVYLVHIFVYRFAYDIFHIDGNSFNPSFFIPCLSLIIFVISCLIVAIMKKIPILQKFVM